jgi:hypothetical protein
MRDGLGSARIWQRNIQRAWAWALNLSTNIHHADGSLRATGAAGGMPSRVRRSGYGHTGEDGSYDFKEDGRGEGNGEDGFPSEPLLRCAG